MIKNDGGPAFPSESATVYDHEADFAKQVSSMRGMSLRDWFAGQALIALMGMRHATQAIGEVSRDRRQANR